MYLMMCAKKDKGGGVMERLTREMTFEEEYIILKKEVKELFDKEDRESEPPESHCVVRRALRCIKKLVSELEPYKAYKDLEEQGLLLRLPCGIGADIDNPLEPLKLQSALKSEIFKYEYRKEHKPQDINILDYTIIYALKHCLEEQLKAGGNNDV